MLSGNVVQLLVLGDSLRRLGGFEQCLVETTTCVLKLRISVKDQIE